MAASVKTTWDAFGVRCISSPSAFVARVINHDDRVVTPRFVEVNWAPTEGPSRVIYSLSVDNLVSVIADLPHTRAGSLEAYHVFEVLNPEGRQQLMLASTRSPGFSSLLWRMAAICTPGCWSRHVTDRFFHGVEQFGNITCVMNLEIVKLLEPLTERMTEAMKKMLMVRARQLLGKQNCSHLLQSAMRDRSRTGTLKLTCVAADLRIQSTVASGFAHHGSGNLVEIAHRMNSDRQILFNWGDWYYGGGNPQFRTSSVSRVIHTGCVGGKTVFAKTQGALACASKLYRIPQNIESMVRSGYQLSQLVNSDNQDWGFWGGPGAKFELAMVRMLGTSGPSLVSAFLGACQFAISAKTHRWILIGNVATALVG